MSEMFSGISTYQRMLNYHLNRHNVIASNIANIDTPGYVSKDLEAPKENKDDFGELLVRHKLDIKEQSFDEEEKSEIYDDPSAVPGNDGNTVDLDREMGKLAANTIKYQAIATIVNKKLGMLRYAANDAK